MREAYDCVVVGGGPAGCAAAAIVAEAGFSTLVVERERMPRFHIGESLMPETYWTLKRIGVLDKMKNSDFVKKYSVQFISGTGREGIPFYFTEHDPGEWSQTWQVERAKFDQMLFDNAAEKGADCYDQTRMVDLLRDESGRCTGIELQLADGQKKQVSSKVLIDASGQQAVVANRLGLRVEDPRLKKAAVWTYYKNAQRDPGQHGGATLVMHTAERKSWFWYIPLSNNITSIGVVGDATYLFNGRGTPEDIYREELQRCPGLHERLASAEQVDKVHVAKEYSYYSREIAGDGWVLAGDAFAFIDPIYSSGVYFALTSGERAADAVVAALREGDTSKEKLGSWATDFRAGTQWVRLLVEAYYTNEFSFGQFLKVHPEHKGNVVDVLIGRIFTPEAGRMFSDMDAWIDRSKLTGPAAMMPLDSQDDMVAIA